MVEDSNVTHVLDIAHFRALSHTESKRQPPKTMDTEGELGGLCERYETTWEATEGRVRELQGALAKEKAVNKELRAHIEMYKARECEATALVQVFADNHG